MSINSFNIKEKEYLDSDQVANDSHAIAANAYNKVEVISNSDDFLALRDQWNTLDESSNKSTLFNSWDWIYTWWETYEKQGKRSLYILSCTNIENEVIGIAPFQIVNNPKKYFPCNRQLIMLSLIHI